MNRYRIYRIKTCYGAKINAFSSSVIDINDAHQRVNDKHDLIKTNGLCSRTNYMCAMQFSGSKCKAQFEVREHLNEKPSKKSR